MDKQTKEIMDILQEECAEVIQAVSKCSRFGIDTISMRTEKSNRHNLTEEVGDVLCMIDLLIERGILTDSDVYDARAAKKVKLEKWSTIFKEDV